MSFPEVLGHEAVRLALGPGLGASCCQGSPASLCRGGRLSRAHGVQELFWGDVGSYRVAAAGR